MLNSVRTLKNQILEILVDNAVNNSHPGALACETIASKLHISAGQTRDIIKSMDQHGVIETTQEGEFSIITRKGFEYLYQTRH